MKALEEGDGYAVAILVRNKTAFYCVPPGLYEMLVNFYREHADCENG